MPEDPTTTIEVDLTDVDVKSPVGHSARLYQQRHESTGSSEVGSSQSNPLMIEDNDDVTSENGTFTRATSVESKVGTPSTHPGERPKTPSCLNPHTTANHLTEPTDRPSATLLQQTYGSIIGHNNHGRMAAATSPRTSAAPLSLRSQTEDIAHREEEWEITNIVGKRRVGKSCEYKIRWKSTWLPKRELYNARWLVRRFEARGRAA